MVAPTLRDDFLRDGFVHLPNALDSETTALALECWQWSIDHPGPASARLYRNTLVLVEDAGAARGLPTQEPGFFYQDISNPAAADTYAPLLRSPALMAVLTDLIDGDAAWFLGEQVFLKESDTPPTGWHQDVSDIAAQGDELIAF